MYRDQTVQNLWVEHIVLLRNSLEPSWGRPQLARIGLCFRVTCITETERGETATQEKGREMVCRCMVVQHALAGFSVTQLPLIFHCFLRLAHSSTFHSVSRKEKGLLQQRRRQGDMESICRVGGVELGVDEDREWKWEEKRTWEAVVEETASIQPHLARPATRTYFTNLIFLSTIFLFLHPSSPLQLFFFSALVF